MSDLLFGKIIERLDGAAREAFDPTAATDSDGYDQSVRQGIELAADIVREEFDRDSPFLLWVDQTRTTLVRLWPSGMCEFATRPDDAHTWGPPTKLERERV